MNNFKHVLIPSKGEPVTLNKNETFIIKAGNGIVDIVDLTHNNFGAVFTVRNKAGKFSIFKPRVYQKPFDVVNTENIRAILNGFIHINGMSLYREVQLCPNGAKAIPEVFDTPTTKDVPGEYIIWCPSSNLPPRVILKSEKQARAVARSMSERHNGTFFWARLSGKVEQKEVPITKIVKQTVTTPL